MKLFKTHITIGQKRYTVPERITVGQYEQVRSIGIESQKAKMLSAATILDCNPSELLAISEEEQEMCFAMAMLSMTSLEAFVAEPISLQLNFGQFVDLDVLTHEGLDTRLVEALSVLTDLEPEKLKDEPLDKWLSYIHAWIDYRNKVYTEYAVFFGLNQDPEAIEDKAEEMGLDTQAADIRRIWYQAIITLAGEDFLKISQVVERPVVEALNYLAYMKSQADKRAEEHKRQMAKNKLKV